MLRIDAKASNEGLGEATLRMLLEIVRDDGALEPEGRFADVSTDFARSTRLKASDLETQTHRPRPQNEGAGATPLLHARLYTDDTLLGT